MDGHLAGMEGGHAREGMGVSGQAGVKHLTTRPLCPFCRGSAWVCEDHDTLPMDHDGCGAAGMLCANPECISARVLRAELDAKRAPELKPN